jgi:hypothetical protein
MATTNATVEIVEGLVVHNGDGTTDVLRVGGQACSMLVLVWEQDWGKVQAATTKLGEEINNFAEARRQGRQLRIMALSHDGNCNWTPV